MKASELLLALERKMGTERSLDLAFILGVSVQTIGNWRNRDEDLSPNQIASALVKARKAAVETAQYETIRPIVEFYRLAKCPSRQGAKWELFDSSGDATLYSQGLRAELEGKSGLYIFYDSRGHAIYAGKAREQSLWKESNLAFNRSREVQTVKLVAHPDRNQEFKPGYEKLRQPKDTQLDLHELAAYFSAYQVEPGMIDELEALLVRGFANDLLNVKMETFAHQRN